MVCTLALFRVAVGDLPGMEKLKCYHLEHEAWTILTLAHHVCSFMPQGILDNIDRKTTCSILAGAVVLHSSERFLANEVSL